ncbi:MAG: hypothetical protein QOJ00_1043 [Actinomycetota bacterium]|jgi:CoA:oxalate CoA-transferase
MDSGDALTYPCNGLRVLDMSRVVAGPIAGRILSDLGADVVKLEPPEGDVTRNWGQVRHGLSGFYTQQNAGKRNVCVDLRSEGARDIVRALADNADVVIENFRAGVLDRLGLGYEQLAAAHPRLIMLSVSGFGRGGPESHRPAYAPMMHAETGLLHRQAEFDDAWPSDPMLSLADSFSGLHGTIAILAALRVRDATGVGQHIDMAMFDAMTFSDDYTHHAIDDEPVVRLGGDVYPTCAGPVLFAGQLRTVWAALKHLIEDPAPGDVPIPEKARLRKEAVAQWAASFDDFDELGAALHKAGLAFGPVRDQVDVVRSPTAATRGTVAQIDDNGGDGATRGVVQTPYRFSDATSGVRGAAPHRGQHNARVLREWLGLDDEAVEALVANGVLLSDGRG